MKKITQILSMATALLFAGSMVVSAQPTTSAPTPPVRSTAKVISIFSDAYTNVSGTDFSPWWNQSTVVSTIQIGTDNVLKYATLNYQGTQLSGNVNALTMNKLHIDVWTADGTTFQITPISPGPKEKLVTLTPLVQNQWNSFDIDLTQFTGVNFSEIFQFKVVGNGTVYIDNLYFYDNTATVDSEAPTNFSATKGAVASDAVELLLTASDNSGAVNFEIVYGSTTLTVGGVSGVQKSYSVGNLQGGTEYSFSVTAKDATGNVAANSPIVVTATTLAGVPAAPAPTHSSVNVISVFSDAFTSAAPNANYFPGWGQATAASIVDLEGTNKTLKYSNLNYQGMELQTSINAGAMTHLHLDVYTENETSLQVTPISNTPVAEFLYTLTPLNLNSWNSFNIPLSSFTGVDKADIFQFKFVGSGGKTVYVDNLYFHNGVNTGIESANAEKLISVFPTAVHRDLNVSAQTTINKIIIRSITGQIMHETEINEMQKSIDLSTFGAGNYMVSVILENGLISTRKIVKL